MKHIEGRKGTMYNMYISYSPTCTSRAARHVHLVLHQMYMSYCDPRKDKDYMPVRKESYGYFI